MELGTELPLVSIGLRHLSSFENLGQGVYQLTTSLSSLFIFSVLYRIFTVGHKLEPVSKTVIVEFEVRSLF